MNIIHFLNKNTLFILFIILSSTTLLLAQETAIKKEQKATIKILKEINGKMTKIDTTITMTDDMDMEAVLKSLGVEEKIDIDLQKMQTETKNNPKNTTDSTTTKTAKIKIMKQKDGKMTKIDTTITITDDMDTEAILKSLGIDKDIDINLKDAEGNQEQHIDIDIKGETGKEVHKMIFIEKEGDTTVIENKNKPFLGVFLAKKMDENGKETDFETDQGILIEEVVEGSAAEKAGLKGADIITHIDGKVIKTEDELVDIIGQKKVGDEVKIMYLRGKKKKKGKANLTAYKAENVDLNEILEEHIITQNKTENTDNEEDIVVKKYETDVLLGIFIEELDSKEGVKVATVWDTTPAAKAGLEKDDIVTHIDGEAVNSHNDLMRILSQKRAGNEIEITYNRAGKTDKTIALLKAKEGGGSSNGGFKWKGIFGR